ncbi:rRNA maturation RNase YbeY [Candidatus Vallotia lariciata]|uniref:rRNA maturation RNase YbeY n=1 Tax=Candidatus Vallotia laricis TaxID=2018052 RepID=UPI001D018BC5|nr:rRNA maturation RNase YbeY [Candidatus Vallotia lariciata]UDG83280.1 Endoribonuclease YbeY [Candidatus Vallotia lariciata]
MYYIGTYEKQDVLSMNAFRYPKLTLSVQFRTKMFGTHRALLPRARIAIWVRTALLKHSAELTIRFVDEQEGRTLNYRYRRKNYATNVLTFSYGKLHNTVIGGDLVLCCPVVASEAHKQHKSLDAHYAHLIVHGVLHAQGFDHKNDEQASEMESIEKDILIKLGYLDPYI